MRKKSIILTKDDVEIKFEYCKAAAQFLNCDKTYLSRAIRYGWRVHGWTIIEV